MNLCPVRDKDSSGSDRRECGIPVVEQEGGPEIRTVIRALIAPSVPSTD